MNSLYFIHEKKQDFLLVEHQEHRATGAIHVNRTEHKMVFEPFGCILCGTCVKGRWRSGTHNPAILLARLRQNGRALSYPGWVKEENNRLQRSPIGYCLCGLVLPCVRFRRRTARTWEDFVQLFQHLFAQSNL